MLVSVTVAIFVHKSNSKWRRSEAYLSKAEEMLEKAYTLFTTDMNHNNQPQNIRMIWLNTSRLLLTSKNLSEKIEDKSHKQIYIEIEEYWRSQFYDLLRTDDSLYTLDYFLGEEVKEGSSHRLGIINWQSLAVIYRSIEWPKEIRPFEKKEIDKFKKFGPRGLGEYLAPNKHTSD